MAQSLMAALGSMRLAAISFVLLETLFGADVQAQTLLDPTRPPAAMMDTSSNSEVISGPVLQSILIAPNRRVAIISGQTVALNGKYGEQTLIKMSETEVVLRNGKEFQTLKLFPEFNKKIIRAHNK